MKSMLNRPVCPAFLAAAVVLLAAASPAKADTLFTNFGLGQSYNSNSSSYYFVGPSGMQVIANPFVASETATPTDVPLALVVNNGTPSVGVYVESDVAGAPGTILDTLTQVGTIGTTPSIVEFTCSTCSN